MEEVFCMRPRQGLQDHKQYSIMQGHELWTAGFTAHPCPFHRPPSCSLHLCSQSSHLYGGETAESQEESCWRYLAVQAIRKKQNQKQGSTKEQTIKSLGVGADKAARSESPSTLRQPTTFHYCMYQLGGQDYIYNSSTVTTRKT